MSLNLNSCAVEVSGMVDLKATLEAVAAEVSRHNEEFAASLEVVAPSVLSVFEQFPGQSMAMATLTSLALTKMNVSISDYPKMTAAIQAYVKGNQGTIFVSTRGRNGGTRLVSDSPAV
jgi:hypothetical protein